MKIKSNRSGHGSLGFPETEGHEAFELAPGEEREIADDHWAALALNAGVQSMIAEGAFDTLTVSIESDAQPGERIGATAAETELATETPVLVGVDEDKLPPAAEAAGIEPETEPTKPEHRSSRKSHR